MTQHTLDMFRAAERATRSEAYRKLESECRQTLWCLEDEAVLIGERSPILAWRLRERAKHLRAALEAVGRA